MSVGASADRVHDALGDSLAVEPRELLDQVVILQQRGTGGPGGLRILVVGDGRAALGRKNRFLGHGASGKKEYQEHYPGNRADSPRHCLSQCDSF